MVRFFQILFFIIFHAPLGFLLRSKIYGAENVVLKNEEGLIIAANHHSKIDPFLILLLPFSVVKKLVPIYFLTAERYYKKLLLKPFIKSLGAYPIKERAWTIEEFLGSGLERLQRNQKIMIFPEGKIVKELSEKNIKPGIGYLAEESHASILPVHIQGTYGISFFGVLLRRHSITLSIGKPFQLGMPLNHIEAARKIIHTIYAL